MLLLSLCTDLQLTAAQEPLWSAAAWVGITRDDAGKWGDVSGPLSGLPWCPNEPNNNLKDGAEVCANLLTGCATTGNALLNDFACTKLARVVCALPGAPECGEWPLLLVWDTWIHPVWEQHSAWCHYVRCSVFRHSMS